MNLKQYPKVELHLHLDSSVSFEVVRQIKPAISKKEFYQSFVAPPKCKNLPDYLDRVANQVKLLQTRAALKLAAEGLVQQLKDDNIIYAEIRFAPLLHTQNGLQPEEVVGIVTNSVKTATADSEMIVKIILCNVRRFSESESLRTVRLVKKFKNNDVVGLDLAGDERGFPLKNHIKAFDYARELEIPITAHAGEACGPGSIWETLQELKTLRIGHGVRSFEDSKLLEYIKEKNIHFEVCPTSNIQTNVYDTYADHTIDHLYKEGISLSVNTDGRTTSDISLTGEYQNLSETFGWGKEHFLQCNLNALEAAFISGKDKVRLKKILAKGYN